MPGQRKSALGIPKLPDNLFTYADQLEAVGEMDTSESNQVRYLLTPR